MSSGRYWVKRVACLAAAHLLVRCLGCQCGLLQCGLLQVDVVCAGTYEVNNLLYEHLQFLQCCVIAGLCSMLRIWYNNAALSLAIVVPRPSRRAYHMAAPSALVVVFVAPSPPGSSDIATPSVCSSPHDWNAAFDASSVSRDIGLSVTSAQGM
jgi:hypothetical protein